MVNILAQTAEEFLTTSDVNTITPAEATGLAAFLGAYMVFIVALAIFYVVCMWKIFTKAGVPGWTAIVPIYNYWKLCEVVGRPGWWSLSFILAAIPIINFIGWIVPVVVGIIVMVDLAKSFGKEPIFALLLILLPIIGLPMLAFGSAKYGGPSAGGGAKPAAPKAAA